MMELNKTTVPYNYTDVISIPQVKNDFDGGCYYKNEICFLDNIRGCNLPQNGKESECFVIIFCKKGEIKYDTKGETMHAEQNDILFLTRGQWVSHYKVLSPDYLGQAIFLDVSTIEAFDCGNYSKNCLMHRLRNTDKITVTPHEMESFNHIFSIICEELAQPFNYDIIASIKLFIKGIILLALSKKISSKHNSFDTEEEIYFRFANLVEEKKAQNLGVAAYCKELFISESRLNKIVHKYAGITPKKYINKKLINRICIVAETTSAEAMPIYKIAERFHFRSASELSRFVKREIKISLSTYRCLEPVEQQYIIHHTTLDQIV